MAWTIQEVLASTREILKDEEIPYRYSDTSLIRAFNFATTEAVRVRPDIFILKEGITNYTVDNIADDFPYPVQFFTPFTYFVSGFAELRDDEYTDDARAATLIRKFEESLNGGNGNGAR